MDKQEQIRLLQLYLGKHFIVSYEDTFDSIDIWRIPRSESELLIARFKYEAEDDMLQIVKKAFTGYKALVPIN